MQAENGHNALALEKGSSTPKPYRWPCSEPCKVSPQTVGDFAVPWVREETFDSLLPWWSHPIMMIAHSWGLHSWVSSAAAVAVTGQLCNAMRTACQKLLTSQSAFTHWRLVIFSKAINSTSTAHVEPGNSFSPEQRCSETEQVSAQPDHCWQLDERILQVRCRHC